MQSNTFGYAGIKVLDSTNAPVKGATVTLTGPAGTLTDTTADDGCAVFQTSSVGSYVASINQAGYVDFYGNQNATKNVTIAVGGLAQATINYDKAATLTVTQATQSGYALPTTLPYLTFANTGLQPTGTRNVATSSASTTVNSLWAFSDGYTMWAGQCQQDDPAASGGTRNPALVMAAGSSNSRHGDADRRHLHGQERRGCSADERDGHGHPAGHDRLRVDGEPAHARRHQRQRRAQVFAARRQLDDQDQRQVAIEHLAHHGRAARDHLSHLSGGEHDVMSLLHRLAGPARAERAGHDESGAEGGYTLVELVMVIFVLGIVLAGVQTTLIFTQRTVGQNSMRLDQSAQSKTAMDSMSRILRTAVLPSQLNATCTTGSAAAFIQGTATSVQFYANLNNDANTVGPSRVTYNVTNGVLTETIQPPDSHAVGDYNYQYCNPVLPTCTTDVTRVLARNVQTTNPLFTYYDEERLEVHRPDPHGGRAGIRGQHRRAHHGAGRAQPDHPRQHVDHAGHAAERRQRRPADVEPVSEES